MIYLLVVDDIVIDVRTTDGNYVNNKVEEYEK